MNIKKEFNILCGCGIGTTTCCVFIFFTLISAMNPVSVEKSVPSSEGGSIVSSKKKALSISRVFTTPGSDPLEEVKYERRTSKITNTEILFASPHQV